MGLRPPARADGLTLLRRTYFDLIGLPPPADAVVEHAKKESSGFDDQKKLIEKLLDSPQYGERYGRHWLDVVRYSASAGDEFALPLSLG